MQDGFDVTVETLAELRRSGTSITVLDVREPWEIQICALDGSLNIPMQSVPDRLADVPNDQPVLVLCHHGVRSAHVTAWLRRQGRPHAVNVAGGIDAWARRVDPEMETY